MRVDVCVKCVCKCLRVTVRVVRVGEKEDIDERRVAD